MSRVLQAVSAVILFVGAGYFTRQYYQEWMPAAIKHASDHSKLQTAKWKPAETKFDNIKFDAKSQLMPKFEPIKSAPKQPRNNTLR